tara:strand:- start:3 stop:503 length:501 start_codon:yes stop_codon:yes gene_type:complete
MPFKLAICELHIPELHDFMDIDVQEITNHFIVTNIVQLYEFYNDEYKDDIAILKECYLIWLYQPNEQSVILADSVSHPVIRNYREIIDNGNYIKLDIIQDDYIGDEMVAIVKTFWLRLIQRKWKRLYKERKYIINKRIATLSRREIHGKWCIGFNYFPYLCSKSNI